jgi:Flp pilus assembly protein TadD
MGSQDSQQTDEIEPAGQHDQERQVLERILGLKQILKDGLGGPVEMHELGICYFMLRNYRQSSRYLGDLVEKYGDYVEIAAVMALQVLCLLQDEEYLAAEEILGDRLRKYQHDARLLSMLAHVYEKTGRREEGIATHRRILNLDPENINSLNSLGYLLTLHGHGAADREEAFACLKKAIQKKPDHPAYLDSFGVFLAKQGDRQRARRALLKALQRAPENQEILGHIQELLGKS